MRTPQAPPPRGREFEPNIPCSKSPYSTRAFCIPPAPEAGGGAFGVFFLQWIWYDPCSTVQNSALPTREPWKNLYAKNSLRC